ncbi:S26 family signal peptidase [Glycomyces sp. TRM65418]|uniref:S26 family signal peptidase n=1 Tax=Glycomyces sp. TRM65418 TaxID=2867006 RepID=UPI001CE5F8FF|nr:S26 family signal peptidase [Glycomyces sp. TRM65418]MCC3764858.1 S26 family signal peptidase [Glycomyces sp. TRM65418]QZD54505.1 S26 family signal peptidase [Glycomyces sp. TRM65418]
MTSSDWLFPLLLVVVFALMAESVRQLRRRWLLVKVEGVSMEPALHDGHEVLAKRTRRIAVGDVVVVAAPDPGLGWAEADRAPSVLRARRRSAPSGKRASRDPDSSAAPGRDDAPSPWWIKRVAAGPGEPMPGSGDPVPPGHYFLLSDNPAGEDSRRHGPCPAAAVFGTVIREF